MIDKLELGQVIKNYKELCNILGLEVKGGNTKIAQFKEIERFYKLSKQRNKFIVEEVYPEPLEKEDGRVNNGGNNTKYEDLMDKLLINLLVDYEGEIVESFHNIIKSLELTTGEYEKLFKMGYQRYSEINNMSKGLVMLYQQKMRNVLKLCLERSLERLQRQGIIKYERNILVRDSSFDEDFADEKMEDKISKTELKVYDELKMTPFDRSNPRRNRQFKNAVCKEVEIMSYWNVYCFELVDKDTENIAEDKDELVRRFIKSVVHSVKNKKSKDEWGNVFQPYGFPKFDADIDKLTKELWQLPEGYTTETDIKENMANLFGNDTGSFGEPETEEDNYMFDLDEYEEYCQDYIDGIPF